MYKDRIRSELGNLKEIDIAKNFTTQYCPMVEFATLLSSLIQGFF